MIHIIIHINDEFDLWRDKLLQNKNETTNVAFYFIQQNENYLLALKKIVDTIPDEDIVFYINNTENVLIINNSVDYILETFIKENVDILFSAEMICTIEEYNKYEEINRKINSKHKYVSSLGFIGYKKAVNECLSYSNPTEYYVSNADNTSIGLDTNTKIFMNMHLIDWKDIWFKNGQYYNRILETTPSIINFNLDSWKTNKQENIIPIIVEKIKSSLTHHLPLNINTYEQLSTSTKKQFEGVFEHTEETRQILSNIDKIIYINLDKRTDRLEEIKYELLRYGLNDITERFSAIPTPGRGIVGCTQSHLGVFKLAKERDYKNVLILEDDFVFISTKKEFYENLKNLFESNITFDVCMLAYSNCIKPLNTEYDFLMKTVEAQTASAYLVNHTIYDKFIELYEWTVPLLANTGKHWIYANDQIWKRLQKDPLVNWYCFKDRIGKQQDGYSDNSDQFVVVIEN